MDCCRYKITGSLVCTTPLHIGNGDFLKNGDREYLPEIKIEDDLNKTCQVRSISIDCNNQPYIPASAIKGVLHQFARKLGKNNKSLTEVIKRLFGAEPTPGNEDGFGGSLLFEDAFIIGSESIIPPLFKEQPDPPPSGKLPLYWDSARHTYITTGTSLSRITRTVEKNHLFYYEAVPSGTRFNLSILCDFICKEDLLLVLELLKKFTGTPDGLKIGAETSHGFGHIKWQSGNISGLITEDSIIRWIEGNNSPFEGYPDLSEGYLQQILHTRSNELQFLDYVSTTSVHQATLSLKLEIVFDGPFMINDPSQTYPDQGNGSLNHAFLKDESGRIVLTSRSLHGALRMQAEKIVRTVAPASNMLKKACYPETKPCSCQPVFKNDSSSESSRDNESSLSFEDDQYMCITCRLFGCKGWRTPVSISDFKIVGQISEMGQEFVAIDRFTGGASDGHKFNTVYCYKPVMEGTMTIDLSRIEPCHAGLLILLMRDMIEGDISPGFGRSKGFGHCTARIKEIALSEWPEWKWIRECAKEYISPDISDLAKWPDDNQKMILDLLVQEFREEVQKDGIS